MTTDEQPIIYLRPNLSVESEPTLSMDSGAMEAGLSNNTPSSSNAAAATTTTTSSSLHWIKRHYLTVTFTFLVLCGAVFAAVVFRPGGPGNSKSLESNAASITRGTDTTDGGDGQLVVRPETDEPTYAPTAEDGPEEEEIDIPESVVPTPTPTLNVVQPTTFKPTFPPNLDLSFLSPTPVPTEETVVTDAPVATEQPTTPAPSVAPTEYSRPTTPTTPPPTVSNYPSATTTPSSAAQTPYPTDPSTTSPSVEVTSDVTTVVGTENTGKPTLPDRGN